MLVNDIKKGFAIRMTHGRYGVMMDNKKGNIRMVSVTNGMNGPEIGSIYAKDITEVAVNGADMMPVFERVELSPAQLKAAAKIRAVGF